MKKLAIAAAGAALLLGAAAYAQPMPGPSGPGAEGRWEQRAQRMEQRAGQRLQRLKADLKLTPQQEPLWRPIETQLRRMQEERRSFRQTNGDRFRNAELPDRLDIMAERQVRAAQNMRDLSAAIKPLWATLDASQKETVRKAMPGGGRWGERGRDQRDGRPQ